MRKTVELLESEGHKHNPEASIILERLFVSGPCEYDGRESHIHIHITFFGSEEHKDKLLFRDYLRRNPKEAKTHYQLKNDGVEKFVQIGLNIHSSKRPMLTRY